MTPHLIAETITARLPLCNLCQVMFIFIALNHADCFKAALHNKREEQDQSYEVVRLKDSHFSYNYNFNVSATLFPL